MKIKKEYIILVIVIVALSLYLYSRKSDKIHYQLPNISDIAETEITKIEIVQSGNSIILNKKDDKWRIGQKYPADTSKVEKMLDAIKNLTLTTLVSESENYNRYDLSDDKKISVKAWATDNKIREFEIGKVASSWRHTFVKLPNNPSVYHAKENFRSAFEQTVDALRDKNVLAFNKNEIQQISISKDKQTTVFSQKQIPVEIDVKDEAENTEQKNSEIIWENANGEKQDEAKINSLLGELSNLRCEKYIVDKTKNDFEAPEYVINLKGMQKYSLSIFAPKDKEIKNRPAVSSTNDYPFILSMRQADNIIKSLDN